jgi:hypothetical protein
MKDVERGKEVKRDATKVDTMLIDLETIEKLIDID